MLKTDPAEVTVPFLSISSASLKMLEMDMVAKLGVIHVYTVVLILSKILLQTRCENRYNNSHFGEKKIGKYFSHLPLKVSHHLIS